MDEGTPFTERVRDGYDRIATEYLGERSTDDTDVPLVERFCEELQAGGDVLDAGCGAGEPVMELLAETCSVTGLDVSHEQLLLAVDRLSSPRLVQADMTRLPFEANTFDGITAFYSVIHVPRTRHEHLFAEFHRVCRPDGLLLCTVGETDWDGHTDDWMGMGAAMHWDMPGLDRTRQLLRDAGFVVEDVDRVADNVAEDEGVKPFVWARA